MDGRKSPACHYSHDLFVSLIEVIRLAVMMFRCPPYSHDLFVSLIEAQPSIGLGKGERCYSHDLFVSLIEAQLFKIAPVEIDGLFSRSIREPH